MSQQQPRPDPSPHMISTGQEGEDKVGGERVGFHSLFFRPSFFPVGFFCVCVFLPTVAFHSKPGKQGTEKQTANGNKITRGRVCNDE